MGSKALIGGAVAVGSVLLTLALVDTELSSALESREQGRDLPEFLGRTAPKADQSRGRTQQGPYEHHDPPVPSAALVPNSNSRPGDDRPAPAPAAAGKAAAPEPPVLLAERDAPRMPDAVGGSAEIPPDTHRGSGMKGSSRSPSTYGDDNADLPESSDARLAAEMATEKAEAPGRAKRAMRAEKLRKAPVVETKGVSSLTLVVDPPGIQVWVKGKKLGVTPLFSVPLGPGRHALTLVDQAGRRKKLTVTIRDGETTSVRKSWDQLR